MGESPNIEIHDSEITSDALNARVRAQVAARRAEAQARGVDYDALVDARAPEIAPHQSPEDFQTDLRQLHAGADAILVSSGLGDRRFPFFNSIFFRLENLLHRLVLKYVNQSAGKQIVFNLAVANVIATLARRLDQSEARNRDLENQVRALEDRVADLERSR